MNSKPPNVFSIRATVVIELPLAPNAKILHPEQAIVKIGNLSFDFGAYCYALRSDKRRKNCGPREVVLESVLPNRANEVHQMIKLFSGFLTDQCLRPATVWCFAGEINAFMDWADASGLHDCLAGGEATRSAYLAFVAKVEERYRHDEFELNTAAQLQKHTRTVLQALTGLEDLIRGLRLVRGTGSKGGTEPAGERDFALSTTI